MTVTVARHNWVFVNGENSKNAKQTEAVAKNISDVMSGDEDR